MHPKTLLDALGACFEHGAATRFAGAEITLTQNSYVVETGSFDAIFLDGRDSFVGSVAAYQRWCDDLRYLLSIVEQDFRERNGLMDHQKT